jgi:ATP-binding cassette subfamily F protein uup
LITGSGKPAASAKPTGVGKGTAPVAKSEADNAPKKKLSYKDQRELEGLPALIQQLESQQKAIEQELYDGTLYTRDAKRAAELNARNSKIEEELMDALQRWETLSA